MVKASHLCSLVFCFVLVQVPPPGPKISSESHGTKSYLSLTMSSTPKMFFLLTSPPPNTYPTSPSISILLLAGLMTVIKEESSN